MPATATAKTMPARIAKKVLVDRERIAASLRCPQPFVEQGKRCRAMDEASWNPHDEPCQSLIVDRIEADPGHAHCGIIGIPGARGQAHERAQRAANERGREQAGSRGPVAGRSPSG